MATCFGHNPDGSAHIYVANACKPGEDTPFGGTPGTPSGGAFGGTPLAPSTSSQANSTDCGLLPKPLCDISKWAAYAPNWKHLGLIVAGVTLILFGGMAFVLDKEIPRPI